MPNPRNAPSTQQRSNISRLLSLSTAYAWTPLRSKPYLASLHHGMSRRITKPLNPLTQKDTPLEWDSKCQSIFLLLKKAFTSTLCHNPFPEPCTLPNKPPSPWNLPQHFVKLPQHSTPTPANSDAFLANSNDSLAKSDIFPAATGTFPGLPEPLGTLLRYA
ncbi:hypothetical protein E4T56_gene3305 [Termitomyces sp. T112]|nr:hypothetical protein E4T56_gene3305 [Termitomyces sp. T112]